MQVFNCFIKVLRKYVGGVAIYVGLYAVLLLMISTTAENNISSQFQASELDISVIDRDNSTASAALREYLDEIHNLIEIKDDEVAIQDHIYYRYVDYILIIPKGFEEKLLKGEMEGLLENVRVPGSASGQFLDSQVDGFMQDLQVYLTGGFELSEAIALGKEVRENAKEVVLLQSDEEKTVKNTAVFYFFQYQPYIYILIMVCGMAPILYAMNKKEIYERTICSSISLAKRNGELMLGSIVFSIGIYLVFLLLGFIMYGRDMLIDELPYLLINSATFMIFSVGMTLLICMIGRLDSSTQNLVANIVGLGMSFLCGVFVPQSLISEEVLAAARFLPAYWYVKTNNILAGWAEEAFSVGGFFTAIGIQGLFAAVMFAGALVAARVRQQKV